MNYSFWKVSWPRMTDRARMVCLWLTLSFAPLAGCLAPDNTPIIQVVPRLVVAPQNPYFKAVAYVPFSQPPQGSLQAIWNRSTADTQLNFKGYFVELYKSDTNGEDTTLMEDIKFLKATDTIYRINGAVDTTCTFPNDSLGRFTIRLHSIKDSSKFALSTDSSVYSAYYDPRPLHDPTNLRATSVGPNSIKLFWNRAAEDVANYLGFYQYVVYYRDTTIENDSGHIIAIEAKGVDSAVVNVNGPVIAGSTGATTEYPFQFWVKSERIDSTFFYMDTNSITWAGAQIVPVIPNDSGANSGYRKIITSMYFGSYNGQWDLVDSGRGAQVGIVVIGSTVTLYDSANSNFIQSLSGGAYDTASNLSSIFYTYPMRAALGGNSITLPAAPTDSATGVIVYLQMLDNTNSPPLKGSHWARIFIRNQGNGTFINPSTGGIDVIASYQPGVSKDGSTNLFYY